MEKTKILHKFGGNEEGFAFDWRFFGISQNIELSYAASPLVYVNSRHPRSKARYHQIDKVLDFPKKHDSSRKHQRPRPVKNMSNTQKTKNEHREKTRSKITKLTQSQCWDISGRWQSMGIYTSESSDVVKNKNLKGVEEKEMK